VVTVSLRVSDQQGASSTDTILIDAGNTPPVANILTPTSPALFSVGETISFSGEATDAESGTLSPSQLTWHLVLHHCQVDNPADCHEHPIQTVTGSAGGSFTAPDHEYPAFLEVRLTATDPVNPALKATDSVVVEPRTTTWSFNSIPAGLELTVYGAASTTPFTRTAIVGAQATLSAVTPQVLAGDSYTFSSWSDGGSQTHTITAGASPQTFTATYDQVVQTANVWNSWDVAVQAGTPQATVVSDTGLTTTVDFYESTNNLGINRGSLFSAYTAGQHTDPDNFNHVVTFRSNTTGETAYPYAGKSSVDRGSDTSEGNAQTPLGVRDLTVHPPNNSHNIVTAFRVPEDGTYTVSNLGVRRVWNEGSNARLHLYTPAGVELTSLNATSNQDWVRTSTTYTLSNLTAGQYISFGVDRNGGWDFDATEISWTVTKI
jgi:hypothetical protein